MSRAVEHIAEIVRCANMVDDDNIRDRIIVAAVRLKRLVDQSRADTVKDKS